MSWANLVLPSPCITKHAASALITKSGLSERVAITKMIHGQHDLQPFVQTPPTLGPGPKVTTHGRGSYDCHCPIFTLLPPPPIPTH